MIGYDRGMKLHSAKIRPVALVLAVVVMLLAVAPALLRGQEVAPAVAGDGPGVNADTILPVQDKGALILLHGEVNEMMFKSIQRRVDLARKAGCTVVIYKLE